VVSKREKTSLKMPEWQKEWPKEWPKE